MKRVKHLSFITKVHLFVAGRKLQVGTLLMLSMLTLVSYRSAQAQLSQQLKYENIFVSTRDIKQGEKIGHSDIATQKYLRGHVPARTFPEQAKGELIGSVATSDIAFGEVISQSLVSKNPLRARFDGQVPAGKLLIFLSNEEVHNIPPAILVGESVSIFGAQTKTDKKQQLIEYTQVVQTLSDSTKKESAVVSIGIIVSKSEALTIAQSLADGWYLQLGITRNE